MDLTPINVMLPEPLKAFVDVQAIEGGYGTASDYILALVQEAEQRKSADALESLLSEGVDPANRGQMSDAQWSDYVAQHRTQRLSALRKEIDVGIDDLTHGRSYSAEDVFRRLESRNQQAVEQQS
jgi:antitoxin ParD1/3/4